MDTKKDDHRPITLYLPENLDLSGLPPRLRKHHDRIRYFLGKLYWQRIFYHKPSDAFISMKAEYIRTYLTWRYTRIIEALIEAEILECDESWSVGTKSKGYRLAPELACATHRKYALTDPDLCAKLRLLETEFRSDPPGPIHQHLRGMLERADIDMDLARQVVEALPEKGRCCLLVAEAIADKQWWYHVCHYGRLHTNLTNLHRLLRPALRVDGQGLVNIDIRNSQPLFLVPILMEYHTSGTYKTSLVNGVRVEQNLGHDIGMIQETKSQEKPIPPHTTTTPCHYDVQFAHWDEVIGSAYRQAREKMPRDMRRYIKLVERGKLYEYLMDADDVPLGQRSVYKKKIFSRVFFSENPHTASRQYRTFAREFPSVLRHIRTIKAKDYRHMAHLLQRTEAAFMIGVVCRRLLEQHPDLWFATVHDSILTTAGSEDLVARVMREEFKGYFGLQPSLRVERSEAEQSG